MLDTTLIWNNPHVTLLTGKLNVYNRKSFIFELFH
jgi:hypothetical protein